MTPKLLPQEPERIRLAWTPTPFTKLRYPLGNHKLFCKRDDHSGVELSGNKIRKLEYLLAQAKAQGTTTLITCGGEQSNHARATAAAAARLGLKCHLVLRCVDPAKPPPATGNILLDRALGADIHWISLIQWQRRDQVMADLAEQLIAAGERPYVIPVGGSNALGAWGYIRAMAEIRDDLQFANLLGKPLTVVYACGSGGTGAGLILGNKLLGLANQGVHIVGVVVSDNQTYFEQEILRLGAEFSAQFGVPGIARDEIHLVDGYVGAGYGKSRPQEIDCVLDLARSDGVLLDPVYTGKAFFGLTQEVSKASPMFGHSDSPVVFLHTGGMFGAFASSALASKLDGKNQAPTSDEGTPT